MQLWAPTNTTPQSTPVPRTGLSWLNDINEMRKDHSLSENALKSSNLRDLVVAFGLVASQDFGKNLDPCRALALMVFSRRVTTELDEDLSGITALKQVATLFDAHQPLESGQKLSLQEPSVLDVDATCQERTIQCS